MAIETTGQKIRALRLKKGWTIEEMARLLDVTHQAVSRWELDTVDLPRSRIEQIAALFNIAPGALFPRRRIAKAESDEPLEESASVS